MPPRGPLLFAQEKRTKVRYPETLRLWGCLLCSPQPEIPKQQPFTPVGSSPDTPGLRIQVSEDEWLLLVMDFAAFRQQVFTSGSQGAEHSGPATLPRSEWEVKSEKVSTGIPTAGFFSYFCASEPRGELASGRWCCPSGQSLTAELWCRARQCECIFSKSLSTKHSISMPTKCPVMSYDHWWNWT